MLPRRKGLALDNGTATSQIVEGLRVVVEMAGGIAQVLQNDVSGGAAQGCDFRRANGSAGFVACGEDPLLVPEGPSVAQVGCPKKIVGHRATGAPITGRRSRRTASCSM